MDIRKSSRGDYMNNYILYLSANQNNKIKFFYLIDKKNKLLYSGNNKISNHYDNLNKLQDYISNDNFLIIPIDDEKFKIFSDMRYSHLKEINYKNFLKTYDLHEWII